MEAARPRPTWRILVLGPSPSGEPTSGDWIAFQSFLSELESLERFEVERVVVPRPSGEGDLLRRWLDAAESAARLVLRVARGTSRCDLVVYNAGPGDVLGSGVLVWAAATMRGRPLAVRLLGGGLDLHRDRLAPWRRWLCDRTVLRAGLLLLPTRRMCERLRGRLGARWFPTTRNLPFQSVASRGLCRRFLFLARLTPERGLAEALAASDGLPEGCSLTIAGRATPDFDPATVQAHPRARWVGAVDPEDVPRLMHEHDALVHPSWNEEEGLSGTVIEALQCGLPVIAARTPVIEELVEHEVNGLLVQRRSPEELAQAMARLVREHELHLRMTRASRERGEAFRPARWYEELDDWLFQLCDQGAVSRTVPFYERAPRPEQWRRSA